MKSAGREEVIRTQSTIYKLTSKLMGWVGHSGPEIFKNSRKKYSLNQINQFQDFVFGYFPFSESKILISMENNQKMFFVNFLKLIY